MHTHLSSLFSRRSLSLLGFGAACVFGSFLIGIRSAGEVQPFSRIEAQQADILQTAAIAGDADGDGIVDINDAIMILEIAEGMTPATQQALVADPDGDGALTVSDALNVLRSLTER